jgi:Tol biopolymer transport system component/tRNA A-37 threonylcarbamoyl transferase component Bud32
MSQVPYLLVEALADRYRIERELGQGGMATVYLAQDLRHDRKVAIKVLRPELAAVIGTERFLREIKTIANLQHSHILGLIDSGEVNGTAYYVMPFVEGESLRDRLNREKQLPIPDAVRIASEVASALDYAHRHGVIHRDIKPENVLLHDGQALVADFGIALAVSAAGGTRMTETGMSLGTPHYMSPEQAMGEREITARSDVYALGAMTYEMMVGEPPFTGPTAQSIVAKVLTEEPRPLAARRHTIAPEVEGAVMTALEKMPADRFATAAQFADALNGRTAAVTAPRAGAAARSTLKWRRWFYVSAAVALLFAAAAAWSLAVRGPTGGEPSRQYVTVGRDLAVSTVVPSLAISPDGSLIVFVSQDPNQPLYLKQRDQFDPIPLAGTEGGNNPVFSPDGQWIAFVVNGQLRKIRITGGSITNIADSVGQTLGSFGGATWLDDNTLVYTTTSLLSLKRVSADGGEPTLILPDSLLRGRGTGNPVALPGVRALLFKTCTSGCTIMAVHALDLTTGEQKLLIEDAALAWYIGENRLFYVRRDGVGLVAPFDLDRLELRGAGVPVIDDVLVNNGFPFLTWSRSGTLAYLSGTGNTAEAEVVRVNRSGGPATIDTTWFGTFNSIAVSPNGRRVVVGAGATTGGLNVWIKDLDRGPFTRLSFNGADRRPVWSPDGRTVAFIRDTSTLGWVVGHASDGSGLDVTLGLVDRMIQEIDWSSDGRWIVARTDNGTAGNGDLIGIRVGTDSAPVDLVASPFTELHPSVSPDSRWLAFTSNESGTNEVYVRPFPGSSGGRWQVSRGGGTQPRWSRDGRELFFISGTQLIAARINTRSGFEVENLEPLFSSRDFRQDQFHQTYDILPDGRFLFMVGRRALTREGPPRIAWVENWLADLKNRLRR